MALRTVAGARTERRAPFWIGLAAVTAGVLLHLPMYLDAAPDGYRLSGMPVDAAMKVGMALVIGGVALTAYGVMPRIGKRQASRARGIRVRALDDGPISRSHVALLLVMAAAVTIDVMKPTTLAFVVPGMAAEYGLRSPLNPAGHVPVALLPLAGITGTVIGSFLWGWLGDRIGRRSSILLAGVLFVGTSICGSMPSFSWNLVMCFVMGLGVGGMLPITFALMAETIPARHRGWLMVLIGGDVAGAYVITSWLASALVPEYSWRILWLLGLPTGVALMALNRWIPESPRFLLESGRDAEARAVMQRYGAAIVEEDRAPDEEAGAAIRSSFGQLFRRPFAGLAVVVAVLGLGVGLVSFGFQLWIPSNLQKLGFTEVTADRILRDSALIGFPLNFVVAALYALWSTRKTVVALSAMTAAALVAFAVAGESLVDHRVWLHVLLAVPIWGISSVVAVLATYSSEVYPTRVRSRAAGLAAGASKLGGVLIIALVAASVAAPGIAATAVIGAIPMALGALAAAVFGIETRRRRLEDITRDQVGATAA